MADNNTTLTDVSDNATSTARPVRRRSARRRQCLKAMAFFMAIAVVLSFSIAVFVMRWLSPVTVTFDMSGTVQQFQQQMASQFSAEQPLSDGQIAEATQHFQQALSDSLSDYQHTHHALILVTPAVVMGAEDITVEIQQAIADKMAN